MISTKDQEELFKLIAEYLQKNITCVAIGGTAMMFAHYKNATKDIDLVFKDEADRESFIRAIEQLGYREKAIGDVYDENRKAHEGKPRMYTRGDERFDLFVKNVFGYDLSFDQDRIMLRQDFIGKNEFTLYVPSVEELILLKAITGREKDHEDIQAILDVEKDVDWQGIVEKAIRQQEKNPWILIDLEETLQRLRKKFFIKQDVFDSIYKAHGKG